MASERSSSCLPALPRRATPGAPVRKESQYKLAVHVRAVNKVNPNADVQPVNNPFINPTEYFTRTPYGTILSDIHEMV